MTTFAFKKFERPLENVFGPIAIMYMRTAVAAAVVAAASAFSPAPAVLNAQVMLRRQKIETPLHRCPPVLSHF